MVGYGLVLLDFVLVLVCFLCYVFCTEARHINESVLVCLFGFD